MEARIKNRLQEWEQTLESEGKIKIMSQEESTKISDFINEEMEKFRRVFYKNQNKTKARASECVLNA